MCITSINGSTRVLKLKLVITKVDLIEADFPVGLLANGSVVDLPSVCTGVNSAKTSLTTIFLTGTDAERENRLIKETLLHHAVEGRDNMVNRDGVKCQTKDTIKPAEKSIKLTRIKNVYY